MHACAGNTELDKDVSTGRVAAAAVACSTAVLKSTGTAEPKIPLRSQQSTYALYS